MDWKPNSTSTIVYCSSHSLSDPPVGVCAEKNEKHNNTVNVYISTAHPAKFPGTVYKALKKKVNLPCKYNSILKKKENYKIIKLNYNEVKNYLIKKSQFVKNV